MTGRSRKILALFSLLTGIALFIFEYRWIGQTESGEPWFWVIVALLLIVLALIELLWPKAPGGEL
jgi:uncharacterized membrane protein